MNFKLSSQDKTSGIVEEDPSGVKLYPRDWA